MEKYSLLARNSLYYLISLAVLLWPAIYNGYPIVYPDTGAYIASGFYGTVPVDRPIIYGLLVRHVSMLYSLWFVVVLQGIIAVFLIAETLKVLKVRFDALWVLAISVFISLCTTCGYYIGQVMPDIFTSYMWWSLGLILLKDGKRSVSYILLYIVMVVSSTTHLSNFSGLLLFSGVLLPIAFVFRKRNIIKKLLLLPAISVLVMLSTNFIIEENFFLSKAPNVFFSAKLNSTGVLKDFLQKNCATAKYLLCDYQEILPNTLEEYLWGDKSVIDKIRADKKLSYDDACISVENEFREMNRSILSDEKYRDVFLEKWLQASCRQLYNFEAGRIPPLLEGYSLYPNIVWHYDRELLAYRYSRQSRDLMDYSLINSIQNYNVVLSILYILVVITTVSIKNRHTISGFAFLFIVILFGYLINVFVCEFFSNPSERFSGRMIWLFPLIAGIDLLSRIRSYWSRKQTD